MTSMAREVLGWLRTWLHGPRGHRDMGSALGPRHDGGAVFRRTALFAAALAVLMVPFMTAPQAAPNGPVKLVALGDSLTAGYRLPADAAFPTVLERLLKAKGEDVTVSNAGVSGDTATGGLDRVDWSVPDGTAGVILELGANDMLRGTDPKVTEGALSAIIERLKARGIPVLLAGMQAAPNLGPDYKARFDAIFPALAKRYGLTLYPFFLDGIVGDRAQHLDDMIHPNRQGVETIAARMLPTVDSFLDRIRQAPVR
ncbi:arylesterase [Methylobacterium fujisawaense]|jgi:acyl-CoA thioesterase-1|nr:acyl-CoA thioesterase-1 [Methylobacterium sp. UNCCL125]